MTKPVTDKVESNWRSFILTKFTVDELLEQDGNCICQWDISSDLFKCCQILMNKIRQTIDKYAN